MAREHGTTISPTPNGLMARNGPMGSSGNSGSTKTATIKNFTVANTAKAVASHIMPEAEHVIEYRLVTHGTCWVGLVDQLPVELGPGDIVCLLQGDASSASRSTATAVAMESSKTTVAGQLRTQWAREWLRNALARTREQIGNALNLRRA